MLVYGEGDNSFKTAGEVDGIRKLVNTFYDQMESLPEASKILGMHPKDLTISRDKLTLFLCGWLGGPKLFREKYGKISIPLVHAHLDIKEPERDAWLTCMEAAVQAQEYPIDFKKYLMEQFFVPAERIRIACQNAI